MAFLRFTTLGRTSMRIHAFTSRDFTRNVSAAKRAALEGPVFITDRGRPAFALIKIADYYRMAGKSAPSLLAVMDGIPGGEGINFDPPKLGIQIQAANLD
jgi:prevent-host-death family protein